MIETDETTGRRGKAAEPDRGSVLLPGAAFAAFATLCIVALTFPLMRSEPDDYAYNDTLVAMVHGHFASLTAAQVQALAPFMPSRPFAGGIPAGARALIPAFQAPGNVVQWVQLPNGRWISEKDPGYPFLALPFQWLGMIRIAPLFYGALGCLGLYHGGRRWLGRLGGTVAVILFCTSGAGLFFAWRSYMPTFTEASLIAAGTGALLWAVLADDTADRRRIWTGLGGFAALEAAVFVRYTDIVVLGCAVVAVLVAWRADGTRVPRTALRWWLGSVACAGLGVAAFNTAVYGGPVTSGYRRGEIRFSPTALWPNARYMPLHLLDAMPVLVPALAAVAGIVRSRRRLATVAAGPEQEGSARRDFAVALALASSWFTVWALYAFYTWTARPGGTTLAVARFYVPALSAMALLAAWLLVRISGRAVTGTVVAVAVIAALAAQGAWSFERMRANPVSFHLHVSYPGPSKTAPPPGIPR
ncbi:MAG: hypothetical protein HOW97_10400 [Catenulispora sp.]|nr:hypothetical protein [Catenulispora sp.]